MLLCFKEYEANYNSVSWEKRKIYLDQFAEKVKKQDFSFFSDENLLDTMENIDELIKYYLTIEDMQNLETVMQIQDKLIKVGNERKTEHIGFNLMIINFKMANAHLYLQNDNVFKSFKYYSSIFEDISEYMVILKKSDLKDKQKEYVLWNYTFVMNQAILCTQNTGDIQTTVTYCRKNDEIMEVLKKYTQNTNIIDRMADFYMSYGSWFYNYQNIDNGRLFNEKALELLADTSDYIFKGLNISDYYISRVLWTKAFYYSMIFLYENNEKPILKLSKQIETFHSYDETVCMIMTAVSGFIDFHIGTYFQRKENDIEKSLSYMENATKKLEDSLAYLENYMKNNEIFFVESLCVRIYCACPGLYSVLGAFLAAGEKYVEAERALKKSLELMADRKKYRMSNMATAIISATCFRWLGYIYQCDEEIDKAEFYYRQATETPEIDKSIQGLAIKVESYAFLSVIYFFDKKNKKKAAEYSQKGLEISNTLLNTSPESVQPSIQDTLKKIHKKSTKIFGIF